jgi:chromosome segregation ATPase
MARYCTDCICRLHDRVIAKNLDQMTAEIERLRAERDDLMKANALLHALIGNREAEIERLKTDKDVLHYSQERNAAYERDIAALEAEIERLRIDLATYSKETEATENRIIDAEFKAQELKAEIRQLWAVIKGFVKYTLEQKSPP